MTVGVYPKQLSDGSGDGLKVGQSATDLIGFYGATPIVKPTNANQAAPASTALNSIVATQWVFSTSTQGNAVVLCLIEIRTALVNLGLIVGS